MLVTETPSCTSGTTAPMRNRKVLTENLGRTSYDRKEPYNNLVT